MEKLTERQQAISVMCSVFRNFTESQILAYDRFLADIPPDLVSASIGSLIQAMKFPPTVAEIREEAQKIAAAAKGIRQPDAGAAWKRVQRGMSRWGSTRLAEFLAELADEGDPLTAEAIQRYGWQSFGEVKPEDMGTARAQFTRIYNELAQKRQETARIARIAGRPKIQALVGRVAERKALGGGMQ